MRRVKKEKKAAELYWQDFIDCYFEFSRAKFSTIPSFDRSAPRDLKLIVSSLRKRAEENGIEWTKEIAIKRFKLFLEYAYDSDKWMRMNFLLSNLNRQKDKYFFNIKSENAKPI